MKKNTIRKIYNRIRRSFIYKIFKEPARLIMLFVFNEVAYLKNHKLENKIVFTTAQGTYNCNFTRRREQETER